MAVFVLDKKRKPLMPCSSRRAHRLLANRPARIHKHTPFTIRVIDRLLADSCLQPLRLTIDPGSKVTGMAVVRDTPQATVTVALVNITHRGQLISKKRTRRKQLRRNRRSRNTRYRAARFNNRGNKKTGWLPPCLLHRVKTTMAWVNRFRRIWPLLAISAEWVRFDTQLLEKPELSGIAHQKGDLQGYEVREYLLEKWVRTCAYCDAKNTPLEIEHVVSRARGGSNRLLNLTLACYACNGKKSATHLKNYLARNPTRLQYIMACCKAPLRDAAAVNATRLRLVRSFKKTGLLVETSTGGRTKLNRCRLGIPKTQALDAVCVGHRNAFVGWQLPTLAIGCTGRGSYQRNRVTKHGFARGYLMRTKQVHGFQTGNFVRACVSRVKKAGTYLGRVAIRASSSFNVQTLGGIVQGIGWRTCAVVQRGDRYRYAMQPDDALMSV